MSTIASIGVLMAGVGLSAAYLMAAAGGSAWRGRGVDIPDKWIRPPYFLGLSGLVIVGLCCLLK